MVSAILYPIGTFKCVTGRTLNSRTRKHSKISLSYHTSRISSLPPNQLRSFSTNLRFELWKRSSYIKNGLIVHRLSASLGNEAVIQEPDIEINQPTGDGGLDNPSEGGKSSELASSPEAESVVLETSSSTVKSKNIETNMKNELPRVPDEKLVPGATFNGRVKRIQTFGAFVDIGASIDGLVHISRLSDNFVKEVGDVVSVGQEVSVSIVEANLQARRIALTMKSGLDSNQSRQQRASDPGSTEGSGKVGRARKTAGISSTNKRQETQKSSRFHKGQILEGKVKNKSKSGAFISLPDGEEGFLPSVSNVAGDLGIKLGKTSNKGGDKGLSVGQNVSVCVSRFEKGRVVLALEGEEDVDSVNMLLNPSTNGISVNAFELVFRNIPAISTVLDEKEKLQISDDSVESQEEAEDHELKEQVKEKSGIVVSAEDVALTEDEVDEITVDKDTTQITESIKKDEGSEILETKDMFMNGSAEQLDEVSTLSTEHALSNETSTKDLSEVKQVQDNEVNAMDSTSANRNDATVGSAEDVALTEEEVEKTVDKDTTQITESIKKDEGYETLETKDMLMNGSAEQLDEVSTLSTEQASTDETSTKDLSEVKQVQDSEVNAMDSTSANRNDATENSHVEVIEPLSDLQIFVPTSEVNRNDVPSNSEERAILGSGNTVSEASSSSEAVNVMRNGSPQPTTKTEDHAEESIDVGTISASLVKQLREETGAGMMDCKKALIETGGDLAKAREFLRKKGLASAEKKASRVAAEGRIGSYIHDSRIGVLIEVNCETDFVSRGEIFRELVEDMAMQVAACPQVQYVSVEEIPEDTVNKEKEIELQKEDLLNKPEQIKEKIVDGRIRKILGELSLLEQPYIKNDKVIVKDWIKQSVATLGENIQVRRFVRYNLGEGLQKKSRDFAAEVAAQTAAKTSSSMPTEKHGAGAESSTLVEETKPSMEKQSVLISAALVKQLREETGAGMMDCKKALAETGGDLEKAHEFLKKKGLASADKKSGRIAAEGRVGSYVHDSRIGVLIEMNCETDFVARGDIFKQLVEDLAMQVAACPQVQHVSIDDIPKELVDKEKEIEMQREDLLSKPENIREKIVEGRITKRLGEMALLEQPFIRDDKSLVKDVVKQAIASLGENIRVRRFVRYNLGEGIKKETKDLAAEVAAQTMLKT